MPNALDRTDLRILALLQGNGRATNAEIAESVSLSASACLRRIQRLEADGVIAGYAALVDPQRSASACRPSSASSSKSTAVPKSSISSKACKAGMKSSPATP